MRMRSALIDGLRGLRDRRDDRERHDHFERRALSGAAARADRATVRLDDAAALRESDAESLLLGRRERAEEGGPDELLAHAAAIVLDLQEEPTGLRVERLLDLRMELDRARTAQSLARVGEEIHEHAQHLPAI